MKSIPSNRGTAELYISENSEVEIKILDIFGNQVGNSFTKQFLKGLHEVELPVEDLPSGRYTILLKTGNQVVGEPLVLVK